MTKHPLMPRADWLATRPRVLASASAVVHDADRRILLLHASWVDEWQFPGGGQDDGEDLWQTAVRETAEETGLGMPPHPELLAVDWGSHPEGIAECWALFKGPLVDPARMDIRLSDEHDDWRMLTAEEWAPLVHPGQARVLAIARDGLRGGRCAYLRDGSHLEDVH